MMNPKILENYAERVYGYAFKRTYSRDEADELSQEILLTALRELPKLKDDSKFEQWLWGVASNVTKVFRRKMGRQRAMYSYDFPAGLMVFDEYKAENEEIYDSLRSKIAMLTAIYRDIIILYYYDGLSTKEISRRLNIPEGTVTWRLSAGREKLKKECDNMNETALRPSKIKLDIYGSGDYDPNGKPFPDVYVNDALSQNICCCCYEEAKTVEELAKLCGVPAYYIEERIQNLVNRRALLEMPKGKYLTDFIILSDRQAEYVAENAPKTVLPFADKMIAAFKHIAAEVCATDHYKAGKSSDDLFYLYSIMALRNYSTAENGFEYPEIEPNYDGNRWRYVAHAETQNHHRPGIGQRGGSDIGLGGKYSWIGYHFDGIPLREIPYDEWIKVCEDLLTDGKVHNEYAAAQAIEHGLIKRSDSGELFVTVPAFNIEQGEEFRKIAQKHLDPIIEEYLEAVRAFADGYKKLFPARLKDDAQRFVNGYTAGLLTCVFDYGIKKGLLTPHSADLYCDVFYQQVR